MSTEITAEIRYQTGSEKLQWGRALMSTEITEQQIDAIKAKLLQWGRALMSTEIRRRGGAEMRQQDASMGPCSDEHGNMPQLGAVLAVPEPLQWGRALMSTEIAWTTTHGAVTPWLQWGRALMSTEIFQSYNPCLILPPLQWGRALMSTEIDFGDRAVLELHHASMGPCSDEHGNFTLFPPMPPPIRLQWGRALMSTEMLLC